MDLSPIHNPKKWPRSLGQPSRQACFLLLGKGRLTLNQLIGSKYAAGEPIPRKTAVIEPKRILL